jgi:RND family efflux transporter MFP subunit
MLVFAIIQVVRGQQTKPRAEPSVQPARMPYGAGVAGAGIVEPSNEASSTSAVAVGAQLSGVVTKVHVRIEQEVKAGDLLFEQDKRQTEADLKVRLAALKSAEAQVKVAVANRDQQYDTYLRSSQVYRNRALEDEKLVSAEQVYRQAEAQVEQMKANVEQAKAQIEQDRTQLELLEVRAPSDGTILQINIRPGEYVSQSGTQSLVLMGCVKPLCVRVDVDEHDIPRFDKNGTAVAKLRGDPRISYPLRYVRTEPYVIPKKSLTGDNTERVDTRVMQVIYAVDAPAGKLVVGQQMDVFISSE